MSFKLKLILFILLASDCIYTFWQCYNLSLDGDMPGGIILSSGIDQVLADPFGFSVITEHKVYQNPNKFFAHYIYYKYFTTMPFLLQKFMSPIESVYVSCAIIKTTIQIILIYLISLFASAFSKTGKGSLLLGACIITPLFQTHGYDTYMNVVNNSPAYLFFYAIPNTFLLLFLWPFYKKIIYPERSFNVVTKIYILILGIMLSLSGPLIPGIIIVVSVVTFFSVFLKYFIESRFSVLKSISATLSNILKTDLLFLFLINFACFYSLYIGTANSINSLNDLSLTDRYLRIPEGIYNLFASKLGMPLLVIAVIANYYIIKKLFRDDLSKKILMLYRYIIAFTIIYIVLLPLGGFRTYRPYIIRFDTIAPVTIALICVFCITALFLINNLKGGFKKYYIGFIIIFSIIYTIADEPHFDENTCEKRALFTIANSNDSIVKLSTACTVMSWGIINDYKVNELNSELLKYWNVTKDKKLFYQE